MRFIKPLKIIILLILIQGCCTSKINNNKVFSDTFKAFENQYDSIIVLSVNNLYPIKPPTIIVGNNENEWNVKYLHEKIRSNGQKIEMKNCPACENVIKNILAMGLLQFPDESELEYKCVTTKDSIIKGKEVSEIKDFSLTEDIPVFKLEYKFNKKKNVLIYRNPYLALEYCPYSEERKKFIQIIELIEKL